MALKDLRRKLKAFRLSRFLDKNGWNNIKETSKKASWMSPISHGFQAIEDRSSMGGLDFSESDMVVVQREQIQDLEVWMFGLFDARKGDGVTKYLQSHLFHKDVKRGQVKRRSKETIKKAYLSRRPKMIEGNDENEIHREGSTYVIVINGEKIVAGSMGDYRAVVCRDGVAHQICGRQHCSSKRRWSFRLISGALHMRFCNAGSKPSKISDLVVGVEKIDYATEFVILASSGIWEAMKNQEAVNLISHIEDPQEAAECLAKEALTRMSKGNISCLVIRFD